MRVVHRDGAALLLLTTSGTAASSGFSPVCQVKGAQALETPQDMGIARKMLMTCVWLVVTTIVGPSTPRKERWGSPSWKGRL